MGKVPVVSLLKKRKKKNMHAFTLEERRTKNKIFQIRVGRRKCFFKSTKKLIKGKITIL